MKNFKVTIIGNSVGMRVRPHYPDSQNYGQLLELQLAEHFPHLHCWVNNRAFSRATLLDIHAKSQSLIAEFPDYYILNIGVCDAATREIPLWLSNIINGSSNGILQRLFATFHHHIIKPNNSFFTRLRGKRAWLSPKRFVYLYDKLLNDLQNNTNARIICLGINPANQRVEHIIPGSRKNYLSYSDLIKSCAEKKNIPYLKTNDLLADQHYPDGTHFNDLGHQIMTKRIMEVISQDSSRTK